MIEKCTHWTEDFIVANKHYCYLLYVDQLPQSIFSCGDGNPSNCEFYPSINESLIVIEPDSSGTDNQQQ
jgi:hypothetical protein